MLEEDAKIIRDSLSSVMPYLVYSQDLRNLIECTIKESDNAGVFVEGFKRAISGEMDTTKKTDGQIFLNELRRRISK